MPLKREDVATYEGRLEFWDAAIATAWVVCETAGTYRHMPQAPIVAPQRNDDEDPIRYRG